MLIFCLSIAYTKFGSLTPMQPYCVTVEINSEFVFAVTQVHDYNDQNNIINFTQYFLNYNIFRVIFQDILIRDTF